MDRGAGASHRILVVAASFPPRVGGYEIQVERIAQMLARGGHAVTVVTFAAGALEAARARSAPYEVLEVPGRFLLGGTYPIPSSPGAFRRALRGRSWDVVITNTRFFMPTALGARAARRAGTPLVHVEHGSTHPRGLRWHVLAAAWLFDHTIARFVLRTAACTVGVSKSACDFAASLGARNVLHIPNAVPFADAAAVKDRIDRFGWGRAEGPRLLFVGRLVPNKGVRLLLRAFAEVKQRFPDAHLDIAGDGAERAAMESFAEKLQVADVHFHGFQSGDALERLKDSATLFVSPSYTEGFGLAVLEAVAAGIPVVASDCEGHRELIQEGATGLLHRVGEMEGLRDAILRTLGEPQKAAKRAERAYASFSGRFGPAEVAQRWDGLVRKVARRQG